MEKAEHHRNLAICDKCPHRNEQLQEYLGCGLKYVVRFNGCFQPMDVCSTEVSYLTDKAISECANKSELELQWAAVRYNSYLFQTEFEEREAPMTCPYYTEHVMYELNMTWYDRIWLKIRKRFKRKKDSIFA